MEGRSLDAFIQFDKLHSTQIKAEYHSFLIVSNPIMSCTSREFKLEWRKQLKIYFFNYNFVNTYFSFKIENKRILIRDWSLITGRGGLQNGKIAGPKLFAPPPQDRIKLFAPPL